MCVCVCVCVCVYLCIYMSVCVCVCVDIGIYTCVRAYISVYLTRGWRRHGSGLRAQGYPEARLTNLQSLICNLCL